MVRNYFLLCDVILTKQRHIFNFLQAHYAKIENYLFVLFFVLSIAIPLRYCSSTLESETSIIQTEETHSRFSSHFPGTEADCLLSEADLSESVHLL